jgi:hypothetical protein
MHMCVCVCIPKCMNATVLCMLAYIYICIPAMHVCQLDVTSTWVESVGQHVGEALRCGSLACVLRQAPRDDQSLP